jgi:hypothetical protein
MRPPLLQQTESLSTLYSMFGAYRIAPLEGTVAVVVFKKVNNKCRVASCSTMAIYAITMGMDNAAQS